VLKPLKASLPGSGPIAIPSFLGEFGCGIRIIDARGRAAGGVSGVLERTVGSLDLSGRATVKVDTNAFGSARKGMKIWAAALVLDPAAPSGVAHVAGPTLLTIRR